MPAHRVVFIDTSVLVNLLKVPGLCDRAEELQAEFQRLIALEVKFVLPITAIIETGNHISQCKVDRSTVARRFRLALEAARSASPPWTIRDVQWDESFVSGLLSGASTKATLESHLISAALGAGDLAILVERDQFLETTNFSDVRVWTLDKKFSAYCLSPSSISTIFDF